MRILIDEDIPSGVPAFSRLGDVRTFPGRSLSPADLVGVDALIVRSVTCVNEGLLAGSPVRFVGTVTTGVDHLDIAWLERSGIAHASAAGCNAEAVAEYVLAAVLLLAVRLGFDPTERTIGIVGVGRIGSRVARWARALGMSVLLCDPPLQRATGDPVYLDGAALARAADIVTLHVPLVDRGPDATRDLVDEAWLARLKPGTIFINTARGEVVREDHLQAALAGRHLGAAVLDVWRHEPLVDPALVDRAAIATPHLAGYAVEARARAVTMIAGALADFVASGSVAPPGPGSLGPPWPTHDGSNSTEPPTSGLHGAPRLVGEHDESRGNPDIRRDRGEVRERILAPADEPPFDGILPLHLPSIIASTGCDSSVPAWRQAAAVVAHVGDLTALDQAFRGSFLSADPARGFDAVRKAGAARREFRAYRLGAASAPPDVIRLLSTLGFAAQ